MLRVVLGLIVSRYGYLFQVPTNSFFWSDAVFSIIVCIINLRTCEKKVSFFIQYAYHSYIQIIDESCLLCIKKNQNVMYLPWEYFGGTQLPTWFWTLGHTFSFSMLSWICESVDSLEPTIGRDPWSGILIWFLVWRR